MINDLLNAYDLARRIDSTTLAQMRYAARSFAQFSQTFTSESVNAWIRHLERTGKSPSTVRTYRGAVLTLWNFAIERRLTQDKPEGIRSVKVPQKNATAFNARMFCRFDERILWMVAGDKWIWNQSSVGNGTIWRIAREQQQQGKLHPVQYPIEIPERCIAAATNVDSIVCDPFMGSGTTGVACVRLGRGFTGIELERKYFDIACERIDAEFERLALFEPPPPKVVQGQMFA